MRMVRFPESMPGSLSRPSAADQPGREEGAASADDLHQAALDRRQDGPKLMAAAQDHPGFVDQGVHPLLVMERGPLLDLIFGPLGAAPKGPESGMVPAEFQRIILPLAGGHHAPVEIDDPAELRPGEADLRGGGPRKRVDVTHQALSRSFPL